MSTLDISLSSEDITKNDLKFSPSPSLCQQNIKSLSTSQEINKTNTNNTQILKNNNINSSIKHTEINNKFNQKPFIKHSKIKSQIENDYIEEYKIDFDTNNTKSNDEKEKKKKYDKKKIIKITSILTISIFAILILIGCEIGLSFISDNSLISQDITTIEGNNINSFTMTGNYIEVRVRYNSLCIKYYDSDIITEYPSNKTFIINSNDVKEFLNCDLLENDTKVENLYLCHYHVVNNVKLDGDVLQSTITDILPSLFGLSNSSTTTTLTTIQSCLGSLVAFILVTMLDLLGIRKMLTSENNVNQIRQSVSVSISRRNSLNNKEMNMLKLSNSEPKLN